MTDADLIDEYIRTRGVTRCPTVALLPTTATVRADLVERVSAQEARYKALLAKGGRSSQRHRRYGERGRARK